MPSKQSQPEIKNKMGIEDGIEKQAIKSKYLSEKQNHYGTNHMFQILEESQLTYILDLTKDNNIMPAWEYNGK